MSTERRLRAVELRQKGLSIKAISKILPAAQSSVSIWVRNVKLSESQLHILKTNMHSPASIEKRRINRLTNELAKRTKVIETAANEITKISARELWLIGTVLYWAEGAKRQRTVQFSNGDPEMIRLMLRYFREICEAPERKLRAYIHIHPHLSVKRSEAYWQDVTQINKSQFYKTFNKKNISSKGVRHSLPYGVCDIYVLDSRLWLKIMGWIKGIHLNVNAQEHSFTKKEL